MVEDGRSSGREIAPRIATTVVAVVFTGFVLNAFVYVLVDNALPPVLVALSAVLLIASLALQLRFISASASALRPTRRAFAVAVQGLLVTLPVAVFGFSWLGMVGFLSGGALLVLPGRWRWPCFAAVGLGAALLTGRVVAAPLTVLYVGILTCLTGLIVFGLSRLPELVRSLGDARSELADRAVTDERLRLTRDLHALLNDRLETVAQNVEGTLRLGERRHEAAAELSGVVAVARKALADVRAVSRSFRELSLRNEVSSVGSMLRNGGIELAVALDDDALDPDVGAALVAVLRAGTDNLLQHGRPRSCTVRLARRAASVVFELTNDGVTDPGTHHSAAVPPGGTLERLADELHLVGGSLRAGPGGGDTWVLRAELPVGAPAQMAVPAQRAGQHAWQLVPLMRAGPARLLLVAVLVGYAADAVIFVQQAPLSPLANVVSTVCTVGVLVMQIGWFGRASPAPTAGGRWGLLLLQALLVFGPSIAFASPMVNLPGFLAASALLVLGQRTGLAAFAATVVAVVATQAAYGGGLVGVVFGFVITLNQGLVVYGFTRLQALVTGLHEARLGLARTAVTEERLRFARDLHDLLGYSLTAITLKGELTQRMLELDPARATRDLREMLGIARGALEDVRAVSGVSRDLVLDDELASVTSVLKAADVQVEVRNELDCVPLTISSVLATVLREGVTNLLRHSDATWCSIVLHEHGDRAVLAVENDGAPDLPVLIHGSGLTNLASRLTAVSGRLEAGGVAERRYRLLAEIPLDASA